ncbi:MAG: M20 family metallo-hydrolase [candidate division KSB1 bacterium]|nr:M20 family metallo-hydrolase [candidate division KSB1 bacterium]MDZ7275063.1 M20 family metallo-hydrolase [candidate division KSB1 bacterium]MDZ7286489.1 M20 family metallo-hydrolase [candidate division KSB1 bacterium]MDZ7299347.1 M20 family metallo-hydrolase [candidate division KSB1 bacterium]MDZ7306324.1 M20 family metallo-hydrolase [candidate division KSB1 bacterium]
MNPKLNTPLTHALERLEQFHEEAIALQRQLTRIPALAPENGGEGEKAKADFLYDWLRQTMPPDEMQWFNAPDARVPCGYRPNLLARFKGASASRTIWIMTHLDVVPPGDLSKWTGDPWTLRVEADGRGRRKLIGRGTEDNQQGLVSAVLAMKALHDLSLLPVHDVALLFVADEETGSVHGAQYLLQHHRRLFQTHDLMIIPDAGDARGAMIEVAEKSILWLRFQTLGRQCHGSEPEKGRNAHKAASYLACRLDSLYRRFRKRNAMFAPPYSTFEPTKREANVPNINTIPGEDVMYFDCRLLPEYKVSEVMAVVRALLRETERKFHVRINLSSQQGEQAAPPTPVDAPVVKAITAAVRELRHLRPKPMGIGGGTVAGFFRRAGIPAAVWATMDDTAHSPDEYCLLENLLDDAKVFAHIFLQR